VSESTATTELIVPETDHREDIATFVRWAMEQLSLDFRVEDGVGRLPLSEADRSTFGGRSELQLDLNGAASNRQRESIDLNSRFGRWLIGRLRASGPAVHVRPKQQPTAVKDIAERLFAAYRVEGGQVHLGGCQLADYPFLRLSFAAKEEGRPCVNHLFVAHDGTSVSPQLAHDLGLLEVEPITALPPRIEEATLNALIAAGRRMAAKQSTSRDPTAAVADPLVTAVVWVKHVSGQLQFTIGDHTVGLPFSGWAKLIQAQPYVAKYSGASTFHLAATDDGRIDAFDQIATCEQSGRRGLLQEMVTCSVTGKRVLEEFTELCPVTGKHALADQFATCSVCQQRVSKTALENGVCAACRHLVKIKKDDPRLVWILGEHTGLDRWNRWQLAETEHVYIAEARSLWKRLLVVVDKETLAVRHLAAASRASRYWTPITGSAQAEWLR